MSQNNLAVAASHDAASEGSSAAAGFPQGAPPAQLNPWQPERPTLRMRFSRFRASLLTALGVRRGFFTQYSYADSLRPIEQPYPEMEALCRASPFRELLRDIVSHRETLQGFGLQADDPVLGRGMFPAFDGMAAYAAIRRLKPRRIVEIGSGDSTYFLARAVKDNGVGRVTCIDPQPRRNILHLGVHHEPRIFTEADIELVASLEENDVLFIDSSHIMLPDMDIDILFNRVFPRLKPGVVVHLHDIFLPDNYPQAWRSRNYSEHNALFGWLVSGFFEIMWPGYYALSRHSDLVMDAITPLQPGRAGSFWIRRPKPSVGAPRVGVAAG